jgi:hypothetical protein
VIINTGSTGKHSKHSKAGTPSTFFFTRERLITFLGSFGFVVFRHICIKVVSFTDRGLYYSTIVLIIFIVYFKNNIHY